MNVRRSIEVELFTDNAPVNSTIFVLGATGCGKTILIANLLKDRERFVIVDIKDEYPKDFFDGTIAVNQHQDFVNALNKNVKRIIYRMPPGSDTEHTLNLLTFALYDFHRVNKNLQTTFALDELNRFVSSHSAPRGLMEIIQRGRGVGIQKIFGAQWFNQIPSWARDSFTEFFVFRHSEPRGLLMLEPYGFNAETIRALPNHHACHSLGGVTEIVRIAAINQSTNAPSKPKQTITKQT